MTEQQKQVGIYLVEAAELLDEIYKHNNVPWEYGDTKVIEVAKMLQKENEIDKLNSIRNSIRDLELTVRDRP